jgi:signal transduction histidine kinase
VTTATLEVLDRCRQAFHRHLEAGDEHTLNQAYELGRTALAEGLGVLDMALVVSRATAPARAAEGGPEASRVEDFLLECFSPFEMAHRGALEANEALRRMDERREEHLRSVARELHDETGHLLATLHVALEGFRPYLSPGGDAPLVRTFGLLRQMEDEIRRLAHELRPVILDDLGLVPALVFLGEGVTRRSDVAVTVRGSTDGRLASVVETTIYRVVQEALANVARHAQARRATVELERTAHAVSCRVRDDGRGFDPTQEIGGDRRRGIGLEGMRERVARLGGVFEVCSGPGRGTELVMRIPIEGSHVDTLADRG